MLQICICLCINDFKTRSHTKISPVLPPQVTQVKMDECVQRTWMPHVPANVKMDECVQRTRMPHVPANVIGIFSANKRTQVVKSKIRLGLPFMVPDLVFKLKMICL